MHDCPRCGSACSCDDTEDFSIVPEEQCRHDCENDRDEAIEPELLRLQKDSILVDAVRSSRKDVLDF